MELLRLSFNNLWRRKIRTTLTLLGICIAISFVIGTLSISEGFISSIRGIGKWSGEDIRVVSAQQPFAFMAFASPIDIPEDILPRLRSIDNVKGAYPVLARIFYPEGVKEERGSPSFIPYHICGVTKEYFSEIRPYLKLSRGRIFEKDEKALVITEEAAKSLGVELGEEIKVMGKGLKVVGVLEGESWSPIIYTPLKTLQELYDVPGKLTYIAIKLEDPRRADETAQKINEEFKEIVRASVFKDVISEAIHIFKIAQAMHFSFTFIAVIISALFILTTMIMAVSERRREVGTLRALGMPRWLIFRLILQESLLLGIFGGIFGMLGGFGLSRVIEIILSHVWGLEGFFRTAVTLKLCALGFAISLVIGMVGGFYPAWWVSRINIVEALRYE